MNSNKSKNYNPNDEVEIDLLELLYYFKGKLLFIIAAFIIGAVIAGSITKFAIPKKYTATSTMYMVSASTNSVVDISDLNIGSALSSDYIQIMQSRPIVEGVIADLKLDYTYSQVLSMMNLSVVHDTRIVKIRVTSTKPEEAKNIANELAEKTKDQIPHIMEAPEPNIVEYAVVPKVKSSPSMTKNVIIGAMLLTILVLGILTFLFITDDTLKTAEDVEKTFGIIPLSVIPEGKLEEVSGK
ncbi:Capsular polysaccharide biosynthesis protein [Eubacterium uniforme]|uniref:Capsular polysaccharide biosynthesis protein n=1 Tax=Eubacterium uniforme TaxID=39495 RepID=A0A1T4VHC4_9FIRM|nr:Wzz/FepE/Etk N-terminal domain-containing protein [Eubacterium uniforme]SKA64313.1 Capsular polysaccharide biosynthesis protein [Eubacterium uniforme]